MGPRGTNNVTVGLAVYPVYPTCLVAKELSRWGNGRMLGSWRVTYRIKTLQRLRVSLERVKSLDEKDRGKFAAARTSIVKD